MPTTKKEERYPFNLYGFKTEIPGKYYLGVFIALIIIAAIIFLGLAYLLGKNVFPVATITAAGNGAVKITDRIMKGKGPP